MFMRLLLPTLLLPMKAYSGFPSSGHRFMSVLLMTNSDFRMSYLFLRGMLCFMLTVCFINIGKVRVFG